MLLWTVGRTRIGSSCDVDAGKDLGALEMPGNRSCSISRIEMVEIAGI